MLELRVKLPHLSPGHPDIDRLKREIVKSVVRYQQIPSYAMRCNEDSVSVVDDGIVATTRSEG